jgi:opacity protein-like surface antigen
MAIALASNVAAASGAAQPQPRAPMITCTNPASGATWQIRIDYDQATVDSWPARVSEQEISWHDGKGGGNYTLDRKSGDLTVVTPSSTGGYFIHDHCGPPP